MLIINKLLTRFNPAVPRNWLLALAGVMWSAVGIMLLGYAFTWLTAPFTLASLALALLGIAISVAANRLQFTKLALKNIERILHMAERACVFAFQAWKGYAIIVVMMGGGILLKNSPIPKPYLAVAYTAIGGALFQASINYYTRFYWVAIAK